MRHMNQIKGTDSELATLSQIINDANWYIGQSQATNTTRAYQSDWALFEKWCINHGVQAMPASVETVALYITDQAGNLKISTLQRKLSVISQAHVAAGYRAISAREEPLHKIWRGIRRTHGAMQIGKEPILVADIKNMVNGLGTYSAGIRDRALLLIGFAGAFRRSELVAVNIEDLLFGRDGVTIIIKQSKTDQEKIGRKVGIPYGSYPDTCPVRALEDWIRVLGCSEGPLFVPITRYDKVKKGRRLSDRSVSLIVKRTVQAIGLNPDNYAGHSLRSGLATSASQAGKAEHVIMRQTGHKSLAVVRRYIRSGDLYRDNAAANIGL